MPGLIVDLYRNYAVCQISSAGAEHCRELIAEAILQYADGVYERSDVDSRLKEGLEPRTGPLAGAELPEMIEFEENGILFRADPRN